MILEGQTAIVTGSGRGIGRALALGLAEAGANLVIADIDVPAAQSVCDEVQAAGREAIAVDADVTREDRVAEMVRLAVERFGRLNILINNAGIFPIRPLSQMTGEEWDRVMTINLKSVFLCCQAVVDPMRHQGGGRILNIASVSARVGAVGMSAYAASKGGVIAFTKSLARETAPLGITANAIAPGIIATEETARVFPAQALELYKAQVPLRRLGTPEDLVAFSVFLVSPGAAYITGQVYGIDGGYTMQ